MNGLPTTSVPWRGRTLLVHRGSFLSSGLVLLPGLAPSSNSPQTNFCRSKPHLRISRYLQYILVSYSNNVCTTTKNAWDDIVKNGRAHCKDLVIYLTKGQSASPQSLARWWKNSLRKAFPNVWRARGWLGVVSMDLWRGNHAWRTTWPYAMRWLAWLMWGEQWMLFQPQI